MPHLLLHACCAPCLTVPGATYLLEGHDVTVFFSNSNIQPPDEHQRRLDVLRDYAEALGIALIADAYDPLAWQRCVGEAEGVFPVIEGDAAAEGNALRRLERCTRCYRLRLEAAAEQAVLSQATHLATTLTVSPYQFTGAILAVLQDVALKHGLTPLLDDLSGRYGETVRASRALGMYRQNYCGCIASAIEACMEREARRQARRKAKEAKTFPAAGTRGDLSADK